MSLRCVVALSAATAATVISSSASAQNAFTRYGDAYRAVVLPPPSGGSFDIKADFLPDGRLVAVTGRNVLVESSRHSGVFDIVATLDASALPSTDPAFLRVSPDGQSIAIGGGFQRPVAVFPVSSLGTPAAPRQLDASANARYFNIPHFEGAWADNTHLAVTAGDFGAPASVSLLDVTSSPSSPTSRVIVNNIGGSSGGIAFNSTGWLVTGNGYDLNPSSGSSTGTIRAFSTAEWSSSAANFETQGVLLGEVLSASSLVFDLEGNLAVGGGDYVDTIPDAGYFGVINAEALAAALNGAGPINSADASQLKRLNPVDFGIAYYGAAFDPTTAELFITDSRTWYGTIPAPASGLITALPLAAATRRRRHA